MELRKITHTTLRLEATDGPFNLANVQTQKMAPVISKVSKVAKLLSSQNMSAKLSI